MRFVIFISLALGIVGGTHYYFWLRLVRDTSLPPALRLLATILIVLLAVSLPASFFLLRALSLHAARAVLFPVYVWMGIMLLLLTALAGTDLLRVLGTLIARLAGASVDPARRLLLARWQAGLALGAVALATIFSVRAAMGGARVRRVEVTLPGLPAALDGTKLAQLTDLHLGATLGKRWLEGVVARVNELEPDLVAITGDLVDERVPKLRDTVSAVRALRARHGVFFVTGNHEYYSGAREWMEELPRHGLRVLRNERVQVGRDGVSFELAGIDDHSARGMAPGHGPDLSRALAGVAPGRPIVLLAHQPKAVLEAQRHGVGLVLSGHTHGGQIWPWRYFVYLQQPVVAGLRRYGETQVYVSDGTGFWGPPMRLGTRSEITLITLRAPAQPGGAAAHIR